MTLSRFISTSVFAVLLGLAAAAGAQDKISPTQIGWPSGANVAAVAFTTYAGTGTPTDPCSSTANNGAIEINATPQAYQCSNATGSYAWNALGASGGGGGLSGMSAGQVPIAATATTVASSKALAGTGTGITTGPTTTTLGDCVKFSDTAGTLADAGAACGSGGSGTPGGVSGSIQYNNAGAFGGIDMGTTANVPLVSNGSHSGQLANGTISTGGSGTSVYDVTTTTIPNLGTVTGLTAGVSEVQVTDGTSCGDTSTGGGSISEVLRYVSVGTWSVVACGSSSTGTANGLWSQIVFVPSTTSTGMTTALNQGATFSAANTSVGITLADTTTETGTNAFEGIVKAYPTAPFTSTFLFSMPQPGYSFNRVGIIVTTTAVSTSRAMVFYIGYGTSSTINAYEADGISNLTNTATGTALATGPTLIVYPQMVWLRWADDGTNITLTWSSDGSKWNSLYAVAKASSYLGTGNFGFLGAFINSQTTANGTTLLSYQQN